MSLSIPHGPASAGTTQAERLADALDPASAPLDGRSDAELTEFARTFAKELAYWNDTNTFLPEASWDAFLPLLAEGKLAEAEEKAANHPQQALFLSFLSLYSHAQEELNSLTERHLEFYYREILRLHPKLPVADRAHLIINLKKSAQELHIPKSTAFKSAEGLIYDSQLDSFAHQTELTHQRLLHLDPTTHTLSYAAIANSEDGLGSDLPEEDPSWHPMGYGRSLDPAESGFALSSPVLLLQEGTRTITVTLKLDLTDKSRTNASLESYLTTYLSTEYSGEEEWLPATATPSVSGAQSSYRRTITLSITLTADDPAVTNFDPTVLEGGYDTVAPTLRFHLVSPKDEEEEDLSTLKIPTELSHAKVRGVNIDVAVTGMRDLILENDLGRLDPAKPFTPFGPQPKKGASFYIKANEALQKQVTNTKLTLKWKEPPSNLVTYYGAYKENNAAIITGKDSFKASLQMLKSGTWSDLIASQSLFKNTPSDDTAFNSSASSLQDAKLDFRKFTRRFSRKVRRASLKMPFSDISIAHPLSTIRASKAKSFRESLSLPAKQKHQTRTAGESSGYLRLRLKQGFLHDIYPILLADAFATKHDYKLNNTTAIPNPPYTPEIESFSFDYNATSGETNPSSSTESDFEDRSVRLFHLNPFGQREEHAHIKKSLNNDGPTTLLPERNYEGELILGLTGLQPKTSVSLLIQVRDGSSDPLITQRTIHWSVLASNHWLPFEPEQILGDTTNGFLTSGVITLLLPAGTTDQNTLFESGFTWLRAHVEDKTGGVCRLLSIQPNAVTVELTEPENATHLATALPPESIAESQSPLRPAKEILQPYASFGGAAEETDESFRVRVSERLRHRNRAITPWDYERLVLENFPKVYRVQCLSHTDENLCYAPGHTTIVTIPDTRNTAATNSLEPLTDQATISAVEELLKKHHSPFATSHAVSADFEPISLRFKVAFLSGHPFLSYRPILIEDIRKHLSPWAYDDSLLPDFGGTIYRSQLIGFIESLDYVDYLTEFELRQDDGVTPSKPRQVATPSRPGAIITSATTHTILDVHGPIV